MFSAARRWRGYAVAAAIMALSGCDDSRQPPSNAQPVAEPANDRIVAAPTVDIATATSTAPQFTNLTSVLQTVGISSKLSAPGPYTLFAPTNDAFSKIPTAQRTSLMQEEQRPALTNMANYHIVPGRVTQADLLEQAQANGGVATLSTLQGGKISLKKGPDDQWQLTDSQGNHALITMPDQLHSNGVVHIIDTVLMP